MRPLHALRAIKLLHTVVWAFFVGCILAIPYLAWRGRFVGVLVASGFVCAEIVILLLNSMQCPLTPIAARFTDDRAANFDIYLPEIVARYNKQVFGAILTASWLVALYRWWTS